MGNRLPGSRPCLRSVLSAMGLRRARKTAKDEVVHCINFSRLKAVNQKKAYPRPFKRQTLVYERENGSFVGFQHKGILGQTWKNGFTEWMRSHSIWDLK